MNSSREVSEKKTVTQTFSYDVDDQKGRNRFLQLNKSPRGMGGVCAASGFPGRGAKIKVKDQAYILRWVKPHMVYFYRFGCELA